MPVVVITVVAGDGAVAGFAVHDILTKPVDGATLIAALERAGVSAGDAGTVLVVDDDPGSLRLMAASLEQLGYRSTCVERAIDGLRISERTAPLAVVLDLQMPEMDGFGFLEQFRSLPGVPHDAGDRLDRQGPHAGRLRAAASRRCRASSARARPAARRWSRNCARVHRRRGRP